MLNLTAVPNWFQQQEINGTVMYVHHSLQTTFGHFRRRLNGNHTSSDAFSLGGKKGGANEKVNNICSYSVWV